MTTSGTRRQEILAAAAEVFVERGFDATTTRDIGQRAGLLSGSLYHHFETKEQMLHELVRDVYAPTADHVAQARSAEGDAATRLAHLVRSHVHHLLAHRPAAFLYLQEARSLTPEHRREVDARADQYVRAIDELIHAGQQDGSIRSDIDVVLARLVVLGAANWANRWFDEQGSWTIAQVADAIATVTVDGLRPRPD